MNKTVLNRLLDLNREFYQRFALQFSATRMRLQPGVQRILDALPEPARILDLGCGNGELAVELTRRGQQGVYVGLDFSPQLLETARSTVAAQVTGAPSETPLLCHFLPVDLSASGWEDSLPISGFDRVFAFAVLHHIPGADLRRNILNVVHERLAQDGLFCHSEWQFLNSPRLRSRIQPWETAGLSPTQVDPGDYLLDWRAGGRGVRYVHHFSQTELALLAEQTGFKIRDTFLSDGEGGKLAIYQIWEPQKYP